MITIYKFILLLALLLPAMPKVLITKGVSMYPLEFVLLVAFPFLFARSLKFSICKVLYAMWGSMFFFTIISLGDFLDTGGIFRCIKEIVYIPLVYIAYYLAKKKNIDINIFLKPYILATITSLIVLFILGFNFGYLNIWNSELIGSGLSNKAFDLRTFSIAKLPGLSHGLWGNYGILIMAIVAILFVNKKLNPFWGSLAILCVLFNIGMSVSREAVITLLCTLTAILSASSRHGNSTVKFNTTVFKTAIIMTFVISAGLFLYWEKLYIIAKIQYTFDSIQSSGSEGNIQLRINGWKAFFYSLFDEPSRIFYGYGFNLQNYRDAVTRAAGLRPTLTWFASVPESFFVECFAYGGIICLSCGILLWFKFFSTINQIKNFKNRRILLGLFVGYLIGNTLSGASIISDVLYSQVLLLFGFIYYSLEQQGNINNE